VREVGNHGEAELVSHDYVRHGLCLFLESQLLGQWIFLYHQRRKLVIMRIAIMMIAVVIALWCRMIVLVLAGTIMMMAGACVQ
jgi:hypothetical protein